MPRERQTGRGEMRDVNRGLSLVAFGYYRFILKAMFKKGFEGFRT